jgi:hypothetical protein
MLTVTPCAAAPRCSLALAAGAPVVSAMLCSGATAQAPIKAPSAAAAASCDFTFGPSRFQCDAQGLLKEPGTPGADLVC